ncbi:hypothetical protein D3C86_2140670 [compost metagenome]
MITARQAVNRPLAYLAVGIHHNHHLGRLHGQVPYAEVQGIAFATQHRIKALHHLGTGLAGQPRRVVRAVVGHHQQAVACQ